jgi:two-component system chemotaxis response regulator CheB
MRASDSLPVLVVDDSDAIRSRLCSLLGESPEFQVVAAARNGVEAMLAFERLRPWAVVLDIHLPGMGGVEVLRRIKASAPHCVVVMLTNLQQGPFREATRILGADAFFHKASEFELVPRFLSAAAAEASRPGLTDIEN